MSKNKLKIKKGDQVEVLSGRDKGKRGEVVKAIPTERRLLVSGVNVVKRHQKPSMESTGGIVQKELSIDISNVAIVDPKTDKPSRVGYKTLKDGKKVRYSKASGEVLDQ